MGLDTRPLARTCAPRPGSGAVCQPPGPAHPRGPGGRAAPRALTEPSSAAGAPESTLPAELRGLVARRRLGRGALVTQAGQPAPSVYVIRSGRVRTFLLAEDGHETTTALLGPGQLVGIAPLLGLPTHYDFAEAVAPVEIWSVAADQLLERLTGSSQLLTFTLAALGRRIALAEVLLRDVALLDVAERAQDVQGPLNACLGGGQPPLPRVLLAALIGARPESVSRAARTGPSPGRAGAPALLAGDPSPGAPRTVIHKLAGLAPDVDLFRGLPTGEAAELMAAMHTRAFHAREMVAGPETPPDRVHVVKSGIVRLFYCGPDGRQLTARLAGRGQLFGIAGLVGSAPTGLHAEAVGDVETLAAAAPEFLRAAMRSGQTLRNLVAGLGAQLAETEQRLDRVAGRDAQRRLADVLWRLARVTPELPAGGRPIGRAWTHLTLARQIGTSRETVTRLLASLEGDGYIRRENCRGMVVTNVQRLADGFALSEDG